MDTVRVFQLRIMLEIAIPRRLEPHRIGHGPAWIQTAPQDLGQDAGPVSSLHAVADKAVYGVFSEQPECSNCRSDNEINPAGIVGVFLIGARFCTTGCMAMDGVGPPALIADAGFTERTDLGVGAIRGCPQECLEAAVPIGVGGADLLLPAGGVVLYLDEPAYRTRWDGQHSSPESHRRRSNGAY